MAAVMAARMVARLGARCRYGWWRCLHGMSHHPDVVCAPMDQGSRMSRGQVLRGSVRAGQAGDGVDAQRSSPLNAQDVRGDVFADQGGAAFTSRGGVSVSRCWRASRLMGPPRMVVNKVVWCPGVLGEPGPQGGDSARAKRRDPVFPACAVAGDVGAAAEVDITTGQGGELGGPQPGLDREQHPGMVTAACLG